MNHTFSRLLSAIVIVLMVAVQGFGQEINWPSYTPANAGAGIQTDIYSVFQRDNSGKAAVKFVVSAPSTISTLKLRFKKYNTDGTEVPSQDPRPGTPSVDANGYLNVNSSVFQGLGSCNVVSFQLDIKGGMYELEAQINGAAKFRKFGVGEVLAIAGQSNAAGFSKSNAQALPNGNPLFVHYNNTKHAFEGNDPGGLNGGNRYFLWYWGNLGARLVTSLGVPVAFYQAAWSNSSITSWVNSYQGGPTGFDQPGQPYANLHTVVTDIRSRYGLRGVLWHQGEAESSSTANYDEKLANLIQKSRDEAGSQTFAWVISQATMNRGNTIQAIIESQMKVIGYTSSGAFKSFGDASPSAAVGSDNKTHRFRGPNTDVIGTSFRRTGSDEPTHFNDVLSGSNCGQCQASDKWFEALTTNWSGNNQNFFSNSTPVLNNQTVEAPSSTCGQPSVCDCGYTLLSANQLTGEYKGQFVFNSCNATSITWRLFLGGEEKASGTVTPTSATVTFDIPTSLLNGNYTLRATPNNCTGNASSVYEKPFSYMQPGGIYLNASPFQLNIPATAGTYFINVSSNTNWWLSGTPSGWASFSNTTGTGNGTITVTIQANSTTSNRYLTMMLNGDNTASKPYDIIQAGTAASGTCYYFELANYHYTSGVTKQAMEVNGQGVVKIQDFNTSSSSQIWRVESVGAYKKISRASDANSVLGVSGGQSNIGDQVVLQPYSGADYQLWEEEASSSVTTNCAGCVIYKHKANGNVAFGSPLGNWGDGDASASVNDIRLVSKSDAYIYGNFKWFRTQVACPGGGRVSAEEITQPESRLSVSSNPNAGEFKVRFFLAPGQKGDLGVSDMTGRSVYQRAVTGEGEQTVDVKLSPSVSGTVIVSLKTGKGVLSERVLVTR